MRVLFITHYADMMGANRSLLHLIIGLRDFYTLKPMVWLPREGEFSKTLSKENIPFQIFPFANQAYTPFSKGYWLYPFWWRQTLQLLPKLMAEATHFQADIIYSNSSVVGIGALLSEKMNLPHVWHIREFGALDYGLRYFLGKKQVAENYNKAAAIITISEALRKTVLADLTAPTYIVFNGVGKKAVLQKLPISLQTPQSEFVFSIVGLIHPNKNQLAAVKAFREVYQKYPNTRLWIVGEGRKIYTLRLKFYAWWHQLQEGVLFKGYCSKIGEVYENTAVVLMCSLHEGMGRVTVEAMSYSKPVIGFASGATPEVIRDGKDGLLYQTDEHELAEKMLYFVENPSVLPIFGANAREKAIEQFCDEEYVAHIWQILKSVHEKTVTNK